MELNCVYFRLYFILFGLGSTRRILFRKLFWSSKRSLNVFIYLFFLVFFKFVFVIILVWLRTIAQPKSDCRQLLIDIFFICIIFFQIYVISDSVSQKHYLSYRLNNPRIIFSTIIIAVMTMTSPVTCCKFLCVMSVETNSILSLQREAHSLRNPIDIYYLAQLFLLVQSQSISAKSLLTLQWIPRHLIDLSKYLTGGFWPTFTIMPRKSQ